MRWQCLCSQKPKGKPRSSTPQQHAKAKPSQSVWPEIQKIFLVHASTSHNHTTGYVFVCDSMFWFCFIVFRVILEGYNRQRSDIYIAFPFIHILMYKSYPIYIYTHQSQILNKYITTLSPMHYDWKQLRNFFMFSIL